MKNLRDDHFWEEVSDRLRHYEEDPHDDDWDRIALRLQPDISPWYQRVVHGMAAVVVLLLLATLMMTPGKTSLTHDEQKKDIHPSQNLPSIKQSDDSKITSEKAPAQNQQDERDDVKDEKRATISIASRKEDSLRIDFTKQDGKRLTNPDEAGMLSASEQDAPGNEISLARLSDEIKEVAPFKSLEDASPANNGRDSVQSEIVVVTDSSQHEEPLKSESKKKKKRNMLLPSLYVLASPSLAFQKLTPVHSDDIVITSLKNDGIFSSDRKGFQFEVGGQWRLLKNIEMYTGIHYYRQDQLIRYYYKAPGQTTITPGDVSWSYNVTTPVNEGAFRYSMRNAGASLGILYQLKGKQLMHKVGLGMLYQWNLQKNSSGEETNKIKATYLCYQLSYRLEFLLTPHVNVMLQPSLTQSLTSFKREDQPFRLTPYRAAIGLGIVYKW